jgi:hypothetical protein
MYDNEFSRTSSIALAIQKNNAFNGFEMISYKGLIFPWKKLSSERNLLLLRRGRKVNDDIRKFILDKLRVEVVLHTVKNYQDVRSEKEKMKKDVSECYSYEIVKEAALIAQKEWVDASTDIDENEIQRLKFSPAWV